MCNASERGRARWAGVFASVVALALAAAGCSGPDGAATERPATSTAAATTTSAPTATLEPATQAPATTVTPLATGQACAPGVDILGFSDALDKTEVDGVAVGNISAVAWAGGDSYLGLSDREGIVYQITVPPDGAPRADGALRLTDASGMPYGEDAFDGEGLALDGDDLLVASEVGPTVGRYAPDGRWLAETPVPPRFAVSPDGGGTLNETLESLSLAPDGRTLWTANEQPLAGDGSDADGRGRVRLLRYTRDGNGFAPTAEYLYLTEPDHGLVELLSLGDGELIVLERGLSLATGFTARLYRVSIGDATDISASDELDGATPVDKDLLVDLGQCPVSPGGEPPGPFSPLLDNFEGMTFGPNLQDGRRSLLLVSDDNGQSLQVTRVLLLAVGEDLLR